jgi:CheY-like chemotaxis protein
VGGAYNQEESTKLHLRNGKGIVVHDRQTEKTVVIVEDDEDIGLLLVQFLVHETPFRALLVTTAREALQAMRTTRPSLFLLDYQLPGMNGLELYDHLQGVEGGKEIPVVMLSAALPRREIAQRHLIGMHKPVDLFDLLQTIENLIA